MIACIYPGSVKGEVRAQPSKSYAHRALVCSALAEGKSRIHVHTICSDVLATIKGLVSLGVEIRNSNGVLEISGDLSPLRTTIDCKESGTTIRFLTGVAATLNSKITLTGNKSLLKRPIEPLVRSLNDLGARCSSKEGYPPIEVLGPLIGGYTCICGNISSQFISSLLLAAPKAREAISINVHPPLESRPYVEMTIKVQKDFGIDIVADDRLLRYEAFPSDYQPTDFMIPGDWSSSAPILLAGSLTGRVRIKGLTFDRLQADSSLVEVIEKAGSKVSIGPDCVAVEKADLRPINIDIRDSPDLFPVLAAFSALIHGKSVLSGITRQKYKESDRKEVMLSILKRLGVRAEIKGDSLIVEGTGYLTGGIAISCEGDHRIAMALAVLALGCSKGLTILDAQAVSKSYPGFWSDLKLLGVDLEVKDRECP